MRTLLLALLAPAAAHAVPTALTHSGRLLDADGAPIQGAQAVEARLFPAETSGTAVWSDAWTVDFTDGYFTVELGRPGNPVEATDLEPADAWLELEVGGTVFPRQPLRSAPYALVAERVVGGIGEQSGTFTATVNLYSGACAGATNAAGTATVAWRRVGSLVFVSITDLPTGATHPNHCIATIAGLPFPAAAPAAFSIGHARGIQFKYNNEVLSTFTLAAQIQPGQTAISVHTASQLTPYSGFWYLNGTTTGTYVQSISGTYIAAD